VQNSLKQLGYSPGPIDGAMGRRTAAAIKRYEQRNGMRVTGKMSNALVASLREQVGQ
jgi:peptidoglycan hydrolase-like protein with peptidoglycan-binding domain